MAWYDRFVEWIRSRLFPRRIVPPPVPPVPPLLKKIYWNIVWGHTCYRPIERPKFKIPRGMKTLDEFLAWAREQGMEQKRSDHPLALEIYAGMTLDHPITDTETKIVIEVLKEAILNEWFAEELLDWMEWGTETGEAEKEEPLEAMKRIARDEEHFEEHDISRWVKDRIWRKIFGGI